MPGSATAERAGLPIAEPLSVAANIYRLTNFNITCDYSNRCFGEFEASIASLFFWSHRRRDSRTPAEKKQLFAEHLLNQQQNRGTFPGPVSSPPTLPTRRA